MKNKSKILFHLLKIAQQERKYMVITQVMPGCIDMLDKLWQQGFIYGYNYLNSVKIVTIYLKYTQRGVGLLVGVYLEKNKICRLHSLKCEVKLNPNNIYFILTPSGIQNHKKCILRKLSGFVLVKL